MKFPDPPKKTSVGELLAIILSSFVFIFVKAFVVSQLWEWYIVSHFETKSLPVVIAFGIGILVNFMITPSYTKDERPLSERISYAISLPIFALILGWVGTLFM